MTVTVNVRDTATPAVIAATATAAAAITIDDRLAGTGGGSLEVALPLLADTIFAGRPILALDLGAGEVAGFLAERRQRRKIDGGVIEKVTGRSVKAVLDDAVVEPPLICDSNDIPVDELRFGFMHPEFSTQTWGYAASFGNFLDSPFATPRPEGAADLTAEYISVSTDPQAEGNWGARKTFTLTKGQFVVVQWTADDEFELYLQGVKLITGPKGPFKWEQKYEWSGWLCAGTYTLAVRVKNLDRESTGTNITWTWGSVMPAAGDGKPLAQNQLWHVDTTATGGTFPLSVAGYGSTAGLAYDISSANLQTALEGLVGAGNVTVGGSGAPARNHQVQIHNDSTTGTFQVGVDGQFTNNIAHNASAATVKAAIEQLTTITTVTVTGSGTAASPWDITVTNPKQTSFSFTTNDAGMDGTSTVSTVHSGTEPDPWTIEFTGDLAYQRITISGDASTLTGGTLTVSDVVPARAADAIVHTDETWKVETFNDAGHWKMTWGEVLRLLLEQAQATGHLAAMARDGFGDDSDTAGAPWDTVEIAFPVGQSLLDCFATAEEYGVETHVTTTLGLQGWQRRGTDRTATVTVDYDAIGWTADENGQITNRALLDTVEGWVDVEATGLDPTAERRTEQIAIGAADSIGAAEVPVQEYIDDRAVARDDVVYEWPNAVGGFEPLADAFVGDFVTGPGFDTTATALRVLAFGLRIDDDSEVRHWRVTAGEMAP